MTCVKQIISQIRCMHVHFLWRYVLNIDWHQLSATTQRHDWRHRPPWWRHVTATDYEARAANRKWTGDRTSSLPVYRSRKSHQGRHDYVVNQFIELKSINRATSFGCQQVIFSKIRQNVQTKNKYLNYRHSVYLLGNGAKGVKYVHGKKWRTYRYDDDIIINLWLNL